MRDMARHAFTAPEKESAVQETIAKVNKIMRLLQIVAGNAAVFNDGFSVEWYGISLWIYDTFNADGTRISDTAKANMANAVRTLRRFTNGTTEKGANDWSYWVDIILPNGDGKIRVQASRDAVCTKKVVGTKEVEEPDYDAAPKVKRTVDIIEWECDPLLAGAE